MAAISLSDAAAEKIHGLVTSQQKPDHGLRLKVVGGGCSGLQYKMDLDVERDGRQDLRPTAMPRSSSIARAFSI